MFLSPETKQSEKFSVTGATMKLISSKFVSLSSSGGKWKAVSAAEKMSEEEEDFQGSENE